MKTLSVYSLKKEEYKEVMEELSEELLLDFMFTPLTPHNQYRIGFVNNLDGSLISVQRDGILMTIRDQRKVPEPNEVLVHTQIRIDAHKREHEVEPNSRQKAVMKAEVITSLLPTTFPKAHVDSKVFLRKDGVLFCEGNGKRSEDLITLIRKMLGSFPVTHYETDTPVGDLLDSLVKAGKPSEEGITESGDDYFELLNQVTLVTQEDRTVNISKACVYNSEAQELVEQGSYVTQLSVLYDGMVSFTLKDDFTLNGLKFSSTLFDDGAECETEEDKLRAMAGDEVLILQELSKVVDEIIKRCSEEGE